MYEDSIGIEQALLYAEGPCLHGRLAFSSELVLFTGSWLRRNSSSSEIDDQRDAAWQPAASDYNTVK